LRPQPDKKTAGPFASSASGSKQMAHSSAACSPPKMHSNMAICSAHERTHSSYVHRVHCKTTMFNVGQTRHIQGRLYSCAKGRPLSRIGMRKSLALLAACAASASAFAPIGCVPQLRIRARASFIARGTNRGRSAVLAPLHVRTCLGRKQKQAG